ncbi:MAG: cytochrome P450 [Actinomycetota bacterium]|nr:cytochrome P450 [Actinomycetota bacterium]
MTTLEPTPHPAADPVSDYDIFDPAFVADPYPTYAEIRSRCPVAHTDRHGGSWMPTTYEALREIAKDTTTFSSDEILVFPTEVLPDDEPYADVAAPPITSDPPEHGWARRLILPFFSPDAVRPYEERTRELCNRLIDRFADTGRADVGTDYAQQIPVRVIAAVLGVDDSQADVFVGWVRAILETGHADAERRLQARGELLAFFAAQMADRRANPREDDLITRLVQAEIDGEPLSDEHILGTCNLMLVAGIDTTWSAIGSALWHLAQHPEHRRQLRDDPELWPLAIEELLRAYAPVTMARVVTTDTTYAGCPMHEGDKVIMAFPAANRDPAVFEDPDVVQLDRLGNRHLAFGSGIHRCAGSNLARLELRVATQVFLERIPDFELVDPAAVTWAGGQVRGPRVCEVRWT